MNNKIVLVGCFISIIMIFSCDTAERKKELREEAQREIVDKNKLEKELKEQIIIEDTKIYGLISKINQQLEIDSFEMKIEEYNLTESLMKQGEYTVFAPIDNAFNSKINSPFDSGSKSYSKERAQQAINYHIVPKNWTSDKLETEIKNNGGKLALQTKSGDSLQALLVKDEIILKDERGKNARVIKSNITASNGTLHIIDAVLLPQ